MEKYQKSLNIGVITLPAFKPGNIPSSNLVNLMYAFSGSVYVITDDERNITINRNNKVHIYKVEYKASTNLFAWVVNHILPQLRISYKLAKLRKDVYLWIFFIGGDTLLLPMLTIKLLNKKVVSALAGSSIEVAMNEKHLLIELLKILRGINFTLSDRIIIYSKGLVEKWHLEKYRGKISIAHKHFLDFNTFWIQKRLSERDNLVSYIGNLSEVKGASNFLEAIQKTLERKNTIKFLIGGDGQLRDKIGRYLEKEKLNNIVKLTGWIPHEELPKYLNELKLIVIPSYSEGLPNIMLEAMACGTPVLATPVGAIPEVIKDCETGFIMENNSPECIAENVIRALEYPNLDEIVKNARELMEKKFTYESAVERYRKILENI